MQQEGKENRIEQRGWRNKEMTILALAKPAESVKRENYLIKALMVGKSGSGKTTSAGLTLPKSTLVIDYDNRAESLAGAEGIDVIKLLPTATDVMAWRKVTELEAELWGQVRKKTLKYKSILEAGLSAMNRMAMYYAMLANPARGFGGGATQGHYGVQIKNLQDHIMTMLALPINYVLEAHYELVEDQESGMTTFLPLLFGKKARSELPGMFNECYHAFHASDNKEKRERYYWHTSGFGRFDFMKSSLNNPAGKYWTDPIEINLTEQVTGFQKLLELRFGKGGEK